MRKKLVIVLMAVALMASSVFGCGSDADGTADKQAKTTQESVKKEKKNTKKTDKKSDEDKKTSTSNKKKDTDKKAESAKKSEDKKSETKTVDVKTAANDKIPSTNNSAPAKKPTVDKNSTTPVKKPSKPDAPSKPETSTKPSHTHKWEEKTHVVHHDATGHNEQYVVTAAWDEPIYETYDICICNVCGADCTADPAAHAKMHAMNYEGGGHHTEWGQKQIGINHHDTVYGTRWVQDSPAWDETVSDGYVCSGCGARK